MCADAPSENFGTSTGAYASGTTANLIDANTTEPAITTLEEMKCRAVLPTVMTLNHAPDSRTCMHKLHNFPFFQRA